MKQIYLQVVKKMEEYEHQKYRQWREKTEQMIPLLLKDTLLSVVTDGAATNVPPETSEQVKCSKIVYQASLRGKTETYLMVSKNFLRVIL